MTAKLSDTELRNFITGLPKAELHMHIEGSLEPEMLFEMANRNGIRLPWPSVENLKAAYNFSNLQSFLDLYYAGADALITEQDFYDMTLAYMQKAHADGVVHAEIMFDPQTHTARGVPIETVFAGIARALRQMRDTHGLSSYLIMCFLRHLSEEDAFETLGAALPLREQYQDLWLAIGLDSAEKNNPPEKFARVFKRCKDLGFRLVAHAGEEGPADYVRDALDILQVDRIDHGVRAEEDPQLMRRLIQEQTPLTVCPLSNLRLKVVESLDDHNLGRMLKQGVKVTVNSDDPSYFGGYVVDNYMASARAHGFTKTDLVKLARNSIEASFLPDADKQKHLKKLDEYH